MKKNQVSFASSQVMRMDIARPAGRVFTPVQAVGPSRKQETQKRHKRLRQKLSGTTERPRLAVFRSNEHIYAQVIDDSKGHTLAHASTLSKELKEALAGNGGTKEASAVVGKRIAEICKERGIEKVAFDRGGFAYHGRVQAVAEAAREAGLSF